MSTPADRARFVAQFTPHPTPPLSGYAIAGLVLSLIVSPLAVLLCSFGLQDINDGRRTGRPAAITGLVLSLAGTLVWVYAVAQAVNPSMLR